MKSSRLLFSSIAAATLGIATPTLVAQTADLTTGQLLDSSVPPDPKPASAVPKELTASVAPAAKESEARGTITFSAAENNIAVSGVLQGMEPNKRYQLAVLPAGQKTENAPATTTTSTPIPASAASTGNPRATPPLAAGTPNAGQPIADSPAAGQPDAGKPNGEARMGPGSSGSSGSSVTGNSGIRPAASGTASTVATDPPESPYELGTFTANEDGTVEITATIKNMKTTKTVDGIQGRTVIIRNTLDGSDSPERTQVAAGTISIPKKSAAASHPMPQTATE